MKEEYKIPENASFSYDTGYRFSEPIFNEEEIAELIDKNLNTLDSNFTRLQDEQFVLFQEKNQNYGMDNISGGEDLGNEEIKQEALLGLYFRMRDKLTRFKQLVMNKSEGTDDETVIDTLNDLSNYSNISLLVYKDQWK